MSRIVSLDPGATDTLLYLGCADSLVGVSHRCDVPPECAAQTITTQAQLSSSPSVPADTVALLTEDRLGIGELCALNPSLIVVGEDASSVTQTQEELTRRLGHAVTVYRYAPRTLDGMYASFEELGKLVGKSREGIELAHRIKAQLNVWADNFHDRARNKKVSVISSVRPLRLAGRWVSDLVRCNSGLPQHFVSGDDHLETTLEEMEKFRSDVIVIAPEGYSLEESIKTLKLFEGSAAWERIPAVKRGEVVFSDGFSLYRPGPKFLRGAGIVVSAMAGLSSGYITQKDEFYQLRFLELHRHKFF